jgi:hypothetical protein
MRIKPCSGGSVFARRQGVDFHVPLTVARGEWNLTICTQPGADLAAAVQRGPGAEVAARPARRHQRRRHRHHQPRPARRAGDQTSGVPASEPVTAQSSASNPGSSRSPTRSSGTTRAHDHLNAAASAGPAAWQRVDPHRPRRSSTSRTGAGRRRTRTGTGTPRGRRSGSCARHSASYSARRTGSRRTR